jgi:hypothetical protein
MHQGVRGLLRKHVAFTYRNGVLADLNALIPSNSASQSRTLPQARAERTQSPAAKPLITDFKHPP